MVEDRITALEERVAALEGGRDGWDPSRPEDPRPAAPGPTTARARWETNPRVTFTSAAPAAPRDTSATSPATRVPSRAASAAPSPSRAAGVAPRGARPASPRPAAAPRRDLEDFLGGSVLAWLGGVAVLAGLAFLLTIAVSRGWLGEGARTALAATLSLGLLAAGVWLRERRGNTEAALAAAAVGIAGTFGTLIVAGPVYHLVPTPLAFAAAFATGAFATLLATRWHAQVMGWLGLLGALWAPVALGALDGGGIAFLALAYAATVAVLVWQRWTALAVSAFATTALQWVGWLVIESPAAATLTLVVFGTLTAALALGFEARRRGLHPVLIGPEARPRTHVLAVVLLAVNAAILAVAGWELLDDPAWLVGLALAHIALGLAATRSVRLSRELALIVLAIGIVIANIAFATIATGLPLVIGWAVASLPFAALLGARRPGHTVPIVDLVIGRAEGEAARQADRILAIAGLLGQISLAGFQGLLVDAQPYALAGGLAPGSALVAAATLAVVAWGCARLAGPSWRAGLDTLALAAVAHFTGLALEGAALTATLAAEALALAGLARRNDDQLTAWAAVAFAGIGLMHVLFTLAPPIALLDGLDSPLAAAGALAAIAAAVFAVSRTPLGDPAAGRVFGAGAALIVLYLASVEVVTAAGPTLTGQTLLSVLWALAGVGALIRGLLIDDRPLRQGALVLLGVTIAKVFLYDMASLESMARVGSLIGLGLLLLSGAFAWQRMRPRVAAAR